MKHYSAKRIALGFVLALVPVLAFTSLYAATTTIATPRSAVSMTAQISSGAAPATIGSSINHGLSTTPAIGSAAGQINKLYSGALVVSTGSPASIDLTTLTDPLGNAVSVGTLTDLYITHDGTTAGQGLTIGGGTNAVFAALPLVVQPNGGELKWSDRQAGITIDGTHKIITVTAAAGTNVPYEITVWGR